LIVEEITLETKIFGLVKGGFRKDLERHGREEIGSSSKRPASG
jgi:hypothetical protein